MPPPLLVIRFSSLGDIVLTTSFLRTLQANHPDQKIFFLTKLAFQDIISFFPVKVEPLILRPEQSLIDLAGIIRRHQFEKIYDLHQNLRTQLLRILTFRHFYSYNKQHWRRRYICFRHIKSPQLHTINLYHSALALDDRPHISPPPLLVIPEPPRSNTFCVLIHPGASRPTKAWPITHWIDTIQWMITHQLKVSVIGGPAENQALNTLLHIFGKQITVYGPQLSLKNLVETIADHQLFLSNDSGPAHIAAALSIPQITIFGPTHPSLGFLPQNLQARILSLNLPCSPCTLHGQIHCPRKHHRCMNELLPELIIEHIRQLISSNFPGHTKASNSASGSIN